MTLHAVVKPLTPRSTSLYFSSPLIPTFLDFVFGLSLGMPRAFFPAPAMDNLSIAAVSGLRSRMISLDMLANNLANSATGGFKSDREYYGLYASDQSQAAVENAGTTLPTVEKQWTDFSPGSIQTTGNPLDVAIPNKGFFALNGPSGALYTRNGSFRILPSGELGSSDNLPVRSTGGGTISVGTGKQITITPYGDVQQDGQTVGRIEIVDFKSTLPLQKVGSTNFKNSDATNLAQSVSNPGLQQGKLEGSNVPVADAAMRLVGVMRQFEMLQKAIGISSEMDTKSIQEVARPGA